VLEAAYKPTKPPNGPGLARCTASPGASLLGPDMKAMRRDGEFLIRGEYKSIPNATLESKGLKPGDKLVLIALGYALGKEKTACWPGPDEVARLTGMTRRGVQKCEAKLIAKGVIRVVGKHPKTGNNIYEIISKTPRALHDQAPVLGSAQSSKNLEQSALANVEQSSKSDGTECAQSKEPLRTGTLSTEPKAQNVPPYPGGMWSASPLVEAQAVSNHAHALGDDLDNAQPEMETWDAPDEDLPLEVLEEIYREADSEFA
jgi:hypothetical protein